MPLSRADILAAAQTFPLHAQYGLELLHHEDGVCRARVEVGPAHINLGGVLHGGVLYLLLDVVAWCAAMSIVPEGFNATTHDIHVSVLRPTPPGVELAFEARVRKLGRTLAFIDVEATVAGKLMASARVTKSLVPLQ